MPHTDLTVCRWHCGDFQAKDLIQNVGRCHQIVSRHSLAINRGIASSMLFSRDPSECKIEVWRVQPEQARET